MPRRAAGRRRGRGRGRGRGAGVRVEQPQNSDSSVDQHREVEQILGVRRNLQNNSLEYNIKWKNCSEAHNTWEPVENLDCPQLIAEFEATRASTSQSVPTRPIGFDRGLEAEKIIAVTDTPGQLFFVMRWRGIEECDIVPAAIANIKCPQVVISFYEKCIVKKKINEGNQ